MLAVVCMKLEVTGVVGHCLCRVTADTQQLWVRATSSESTLLFLTGCCSRSYRTENSTCVLKFTLWKVCALFKQVLVLMECVLCLGVRGFFFNGCEQLVNIMV